MKSAEIMTEGADLFGRLSAALRELGADPSDLTNDSAQLFDTEGRLYTLFNEGYFDPWDPQDEGVLRVADPDVRLPDLHAVDHLAVECRWEDLFADITRRASEILGETIWVIDGKDVLWEASRIDPDRIVL